MPGRCRASDADDMTKTRAVRPSVSDRELRAAARQFAGGVWYTYRDGAYSCTAVRPSARRARPAVSR